MLRFAIGIMLTYTDDPCSCGRNTLRWSPVVGRKKQVLKLQSTSLYPLNIIEVLNSFEGIEAIVILARRNDVGTDAVTVKISEDISLEHLYKHTGLFKSKLQFTPKLEMVSLQEIEELKFPGDSRKPQLFKDYR